MRPDESTPSAPPTRTQPDVAGILDRVVEIQVADPERAHRDWTALMLGQRGSRAELLRDTSFLRPCSPRAPEVVRRYREFAREAFLWTRAPDYQAALRRWRWCASLVMDAKSILCALDRGRSGGTASRSRLSQALQMMRLGQYGVRPWDYHRFGLDALDDGAACNAVNALEAACVHLRLHRDIDFKAIDDKERLQRSLTAAGLPVPTTALRVVRSSSPDNVAAALPACDLFVKRIDFGWGIGAMACDYRPDRDAWQVADGSILDRAALAARLCGIAAEWDLLVQRRLRTGGSVRDLSPGGLCTLRAVSARARRGDGPVVLTSILRMPSTAGDITDNFAGGGIAAPVVDERGTLGAGRLKADNAVALDRHPGTQAQIAGRTVDEHREATRLALATHRLFPEALAVGWDIGLSEGGPVVLEGNLLWCVELVQCATRVPLLSTGYGDLALSWLR